MKRTAFGVLSILFFVIYFKILQVIYNSFVPMNTTTDVIAIFIMIIVLIPLAVISASGCERTYEKLKKDK